MTPPAPLCVFSMHTRLADNVYGVYGLIAARSDSASITRPAPCTGRTCAPQSAAAAAASYIITCDPVPSRISVPGRESSHTPV